MTRTTRPRSGKTTYHRDGSITVWSCLTSSWLRGSSPSPALLATCSHAEVARIERHLETS